MVRQFIPDKTSTYLAILGSLIYHYFLNSTTLYTRWNFHNLSWDSNPVCSCFKSRLQGPDHSMSNGAFPSLRHYCFTITIIYFILLILYQALLGMWLAIISKNIKPCSTGLFQPLLYLKARVMGVVLFLWRFFVSVVVSVCMFVVNNLV